MSLQTLLTWKTVFFFGSLILFGCIETGMPRRPWEIRRWKRWVFHGALSVLNTVLTRLLVAAPLLALIRLVNDRGWGLLGFLPWTGGLSLIGTVVILDGLNYAWHRMNHQIPFLWRFHKAHHLDTHVDLTTALRFHPIELLLSYFYKSVLILLLGPALTAYIVFETAISVFAIFHHTNFDFSPGTEKWLSRFLMTPRLHTSHHTVALRTRDANFSTILIGWDRLFRSYQDPDPEEMKYLGLKEGRETCLQPGAFLLSPWRA